jgi:hypothetical protein
VEPAALVEPEVAAPVRHRAGLGLAPLVAVPRLHHSWAWSIAAGAELPGLAPAASVVVVARHKAAAAVRKEKDLVELPAAELALDWRP